MFKILTLLVFISTQASASFMIPDDYDSTQRFFKVEKVSEYTKSMYYFSECTGNIELHTCDRIFSEQGYSKAELDSIERSEASKGALILTAEVVTGGIIWKRLMTFTLGGAVKLVRWKTGWTEGVANGSVALAITAPVNAGITYAIVEGTEDLLEMASPYDRYKRSEIIDTDEYEASIINLSYDHQKAYTVLGELLAQTEI